MIVFIIGTFSRLVDRRSARINTCNRTIWIKSRSIGIPRNNTYTISY